MSGWSQGSHEFIHTGSKIMSSSNTVITRLKSFSFSFWYFFNEENLSLVSQTGPTNSCNLLIIILFIHSSPLLALQVEKLENRKISGQMQPREEPCRVLGMLAALSQNSGLHRRKSKRRYRRTMSRH